MKQKIRCDSKLRGLPAAQRVKVDAWLFEEGFTYEEVVEGCLREFGLQVSKSSVGRYYERISADRFAEKQRQERMALEPVLSPTEAYKVLLKRIAELALEEMDQPLEEINHKVVVRLVRVLIAARREKHMATRVWVERRKAENWMAQECLRHWRRTMKKQAHPSYLPMLVRRNEAYFPDVLKGGVGFVENEGSAGALNPTREGACAPQKAGGTDMSTNGGQRSARPTIGCERNRRDDGICMENTPTRTPKAGKNPRENTHESTIGLQLGENSNTTLPTKTVLTINH